MLKLFLYCLLSFLLSLASVYVYVGVLKNMKVFQPIREDGPAYHIISKGKTVTMGGVVIFFVAVVVCCFLGLYSYPYVRIILIVGLLSMLLGLWDDLFKLLRSSYKGMKAYQKLLFQFGISALFWWLLGMAGFNRSGFSSSVWALFLVLSGSMNAVNLTDGLDGLAGGMIVMVLSGLAVIGWLQGMFGIVVFLVVLIGAILGFLYFNLHPASVFMGDTGSMFLGAVMGSVSVLLHEELLLLLMAGLFVWEVISVMLQVASFKLTRRRVFKMSPFHHHLELVGWKEEKIVYLFWCINGALVLLSLCISCV